METTNAIIEGREADLLIYGEIADEAGAEGIVSSRDIVREMLLLEKSCDTVRVRINSQGGEVYAGIAIFNAIRRSGCDIAIYTDGISASIAGIIAMCGRKHYMSRYSRLMIHAVSGGVFGNVADLQKMIDEIRGLEETISGIIAERMHITAEEVRERYFDGEDHWFTAEEAVSLGLADGIYDADVPGVDGALSARDLYDKVLTNRLAFVKPSKTNDMNLENLKSIPRFANVATEEEALGGITELDAENASLKAERDQLKAENESLKTQLAVAEDEQVNAILDSAVAAGKVKEGDRETYRNLLKADRANAVKAINAIKAGRRVGDDLKNPVEDNLGPWDKRMSEIRTKHMR